MIGMEQAEVLDAEALEIFMAAKSYTSLESSSQQTQSTTKSGSSESDEWQTEALQLLRLAATMERSSRSSPNE